MQLVARKSIAVVVEKISKNGLNQFGSKSRRLDVRITMIAVKMDKDLRYSIPPCITRMESFIALKDGPCIWIRGFRLRYRGFERLVYMNLLNSEKI